MPSPATLTFTTQSIESQLRARCNVTGRKRYSYIPDLRSGRQLAMGAEEEVFQIMLGVRPLSKNSIFWAAICPKPKFRGRKHTARRFMRRLYIAGCKCATLIIPLRGKEHRFPKLVACFREARDDYEQVCTRKMVQNLHSPGPQLE